MVFPTYVVLILLSIIVGFINQYILLRKEKMEREHIFLSFSLSIIMILAFGIIGSAIMVGSIELKKIGFYSVGGAIGYLLSTIIISIIFKDKKHLFYKTTSLSLPLIYGMSKLACVHATCCYGIEYTGPLAVTSKFHEGTLFPVQMVEVISFILLYIILMIIYKKKKESNIILLSLSTSIVLKVLLDFLRFEHTNKFILSKNQIVCISILIIVLIVNFVIKYRKTCKVK